MRMFLIFLWCFVLIQAKDCPGICGDAVEYINGQPDPNYQKQVTKTTSNGNNRIVNGYSVKDRGFVTLIRAYDPNDKEFYESCGGTLINDLYILTAGHCVCMQNSDSNVECSYYGELKYDPKEVIKDYGYCNPDHTQPGETFGKTTRAKRAKDWGFCSPLCDIQSQSHRLMETKLEVLTHEECTTTF